MTASYATISSRGLDWESVPMRLFQKAKKLGTWDPQAIDLSRDGAEWAAFDDVERDFLLRTLALVMNQRMNELFGPAIGVISEFWEGNYDDENGPFGQRMETYVEYAGVQFDKRMKVLERDRGKSIEEIEKAAVMDLRQEEREPTTV